MPSTKGVYSPRGINRVEKLMPGAMILSARQKPLKRYHPKDGAMVTDAILSPINSAKTRIIAIKRERIEPLAGPFSFASRNRDGSMPPISPTNRQTDGAGYFSSTNASRLAIPRKPITPPIM